MQINITWDPSVDNAPAGFKEAVQAAVDYFDATITSPISVNIQFSYGTVAGQAMDPGAVGESVANGYFFSYADVAAAMAAAATSSDDAAAVASLPTLDPTHGGEYFVSSAEAKALGLVQGTSGDVDGYIGLSSDVSYTFDPNNRAAPGLYDAIGAIEHEISEVLGRISSSGQPQADGQLLYSPLDLFKYTAPGVRDLNPDGSYFSVDGQNLLKQFNDANQNGGDAGDWATSGSADAFDAEGQPGQQESLSATDLQTLDVLGYNLSPQQSSQPGTPMPTVAASATVSAAAGYALAQGQSLYVASGPAVSLQSSGAANGAVTNAGTISEITGAGVFGSSVIGIVDFGSYSVSNGAITNTSTGAIYVQSSSNGAGAIGISDFGGAHAASIDNAGLIQVVSLVMPYVGQEPATGILSDGASFTNEASGRVVVWSVEGATGVDVSLSNNPLIPEGAINNAGLISVTGSSATGVVVGGAFTNSGTITATNTGAWGSIAVDVVGSSSGAYVNTGTVRGDYAFYVDGSGISTGFKPNIDLVNSGLMVGTVYTGEGPSQIHNSGTIDGPIVFGDSPSGNVYDGASGRQSGGIYLGQGNDTATLGNDGEVVFGGGGDDTITGGAGNDFIEIGHGDNTIDGGGGFNTLSFADSNATVTVDLGAGTASAAGSDTIKNIQCVIAGLYDSTFKAGAGAVKFVGGAGFDTLIGGVSADTLVAGAGGGVMIGGGGADSFVYSAGDHSLSVTDFGANGDQDVLKIYGYASAVSVQQQGADTLITLSDADTILLKNVQASSLTGANLVYSADPLPPGVNLPPQPAVYGTTPIYLNADLAISAGEFINEKVDANHPYAIYDTGYNFDNFGTVSINTNSTAGFICDTSVGHGGLFTNEASGIYKVVTTGSGRALGFQAQSWSSNILNKGVFQVTGAGGAWAVGVDDWDPGFSFTNTVTGQFTVTADSDATGLSLNNGGVIENDGTFTVSGASSTGILDEIEGGSSVITNTGTITVTGAGSSAIVLEGLYDPRDIPTDFVTLTNSGTISAPVDAIATRQDGNPEFWTPLVHLTNSGTLNGAVDLGAGDHQIRNSGTINGSVHVGDGNVTFNGTGGKLTGALYLGLGASTVTLGDDGETVVASADGGTNTITGGAGNDVFVIGRGASTINGGGGFNTLSLAEADGPVTVDLGAGTASFGWTTTLKNIQCVIGGGFNDTLKAGAAGAKLIAGTGADTLIGGAGADTLVAGVGGDVMTGGGGNNSFVYSAGDHQLVITDFLASGSQNVLQVYGYGAAQSVTQQGADTLITLSAGDSILLQNVQASALTGAQVVYSAGAAPAGPTVPSVAAPLGSAPISLDTDLSIYAGESVHFTDQASPIFDDMWRSADTFTGVVHQIDNSGSLSFTDKVDPVIMAITTEIGYGGSGTINNHAGAQFSVSSTSGDAYGVYMPSSWLSFTNAGSFTISASGHANGLTYKLNPYGQGFLNTKTGVISVAGASGATGVEGDGITQYAMENDGLISVSSTGGAAYGVTCEASVVNTGQILVTGAAGSAAEGIVLTLGYPYGTPTVTNTGVINAKTAIIDADQDYQTISRPLAVVNSGSITGDIDAGEAALTLTNTGTITGNILLHDYKATVDLRGGVFKGQVVINSPNSAWLLPQDVIYTGANSTTVEIAAGGNSLRTSVIGGGGQVTVKIDEASSAATITHGANGVWTVNAGADGTVTLTNVLTLQFTDRSITLPSGVQDDFRGDRRSDVLLQNTAGAVFTGEAGASGGESYVQVGALGSEWKFRETGDFLGAGHSQFLIQNTAGAVFVADASSGHAAYTQVAALGSEWKFVGAGDFLGDGKSDFLIENSAGAIAVGEVGSGGKTAYATVGALGSEWKFVESGDFLGEGHSQFLIQNTAGAVFVGDVRSGHATYTQVTALGSEWKFVGAGDFLGDGKSDFLIENKAGQVAIGEVGANGKASFTMIGALGPEWKFVGAGDYLGLGHDQFLIQNAAGAFDAANVVSGKAHYTQLGVLGSEWSFRG